MYEGRPRPELQEPSSPADGPLHLAWSHILGPTPDVLCHFSKCIPDVTPCIPHIISGPFPKLCSLNFSLVGMSLPNWSFWSQPSRDGSSTGLESLRICPSSTHSIRANIRHTLPICCACARADITNQSKQAAIKSNSHL